MFSQQKIKSANDNRTNEIFQGKARRVSSPGIPFTHPRTQTFTQTTSHPSQRLRNTLSLDSPCIFVCRRDPYIYPGKKIRTVLEHIYIRIPIHRRFNMENTANTKTIPSCSNFPSNRSPTSLRISLRPILSLSGGHVDVCTTT